MDPFLASSGAWWQSHRRVPVINHHNDHSLHPKEQSALAGLRTAIDEARRVFGNFQVAEMLNEELNFIMPAYSRHRPMRCRDGTIVSAQAGPTHHTLRDDTQRVFTHVEVRDYTTPTQEPLCLSAHELLALLESHGGVVNGHLPPLDFGRAPERKKRERDGDIIDYRFRKARKQHSLSYNKDFKGPIDGKWTYKDLSFQLAANSVIQTPGMRIEGIKADGSSIATSRIKSVTYKDGMHIFETRNSFYAAFEEHRKVTNATVRTSPEGNVTLSVVPAPTPFSGNASHVAGL